MTFINNLNNTDGLLNKFDNIIINGTDNNLVKKHLLSITEDLVRYNNIDAKNIKFENSEVKSKITDVLKKIKDIEINVKNKLILTEKYNSYLNS